MQEASETESRNIYIDYTTVEDLEGDIGAYTGAGNFTRELIYALKEKGQDMKFLVSESFIPEKESEKALMADEAVLARTGDITKFRFSENDLLFLPAVTGRIMAKAYRIKKKNAGLKIYAVIHDRQHDLTHFDPMDRVFNTGIRSNAAVLYAVYILKKLIYDLCYPRWIGVFDKVFTVSNHTLQALNHKKLKWITYFAQSSSVTELMPRKPEGAEEMGDYILFVSGGRAEKNLGRGLLAFREFCEKEEGGVKLCISGIEREQLCRIAQRLKLGTEFVDQHVRSYGYVDSCELAYLYRNCRYLLFLSKAEGYGLPVLEAVLSGKTVLCSRLSAVPEVAGSILCYVDALNTASIRDGMLYLADDENLRYREELAEKKSRIIREQIELDKQILADEIRGGIKAGS